MGSRLDVLYGVIGPAEFANRCRSIRTSAAGLLRDDPAFGLRVRRAAELAQRDAQRRERRRALEPMADAEGAQAETGFDRMLVDAVARPRLRLDAIGFFVVAGVPPTRGNSP